MNNANASSSNANNAKPNASAAGPNASSAGPSPSAAGPNSSVANGLPQSETADQSSPSGMMKPPRDQEGNAPAAPTKGPKKPKDPNKKSQREYLGWEDANDIEWRKEMEYKGYENWRDKWGPGTEWWDRYEKWICSGMTRGAMRKPSYRGVEWVKYQRGIEIAPIGECCTRNKTTIKDFFVEPLEHYCCRPCPWPKITSGEIGWLGQHRSCQLEIYPNDFMKKPPLPWWDKKISSFLPGSM